MDTTPQNSAPAPNGEADHRPAKRTSSGRVKIALIVILILLVIGLAVAAAFSYISAQDARTQSQATQRANDDLKKRLVTAEGQVAALNAQNSANNSPTVATKDQSDLSVNVLSTRFVNPDGTVTQSGTWLGVRMTLTNRSSSPISITTDRFGLKDANGNQYRLVGYSGASTLPAGWGTETLQNQTLDAGQSVTGNVIFLVQNKSTTQYVFINGTARYDVTVTE